MALRNEGSIYSDLEGSVCVKYPRMTNEFENNDLVMVSYLRSGRAWWILRIYSDSTFDLFYTSTQPLTDNDVPRQRYGFSELENVVKVGELLDWVKGIIGK